MKNLTVFTLTLVSALSLAAADANPSVFYKLDFTVRDMEAGKTIESHTYSTRMGTLQGNSNASIRTGGKVPVSTSTDSPLTASQFTYIEVGTNFDLRHFSEAGGEVSLEVVAEVSSIVGSTERLNRPIIRQNKWNSVISAKIGKPTVIFSSDDLTTKRQMVVEMTATPIH